MDVIIPDERGRPDTLPRIQAVIYARMSTEHQQYSTENQCDAIMEYAERLSMDVIRTYTDEGKSGLRLDGRDSLKQLIDDVNRPGRDFTAILVYDVSRWGRFQDADESAYYEYVCRRAGVEVHYCAEQFSNDGSPVSTIVKGVKRAMAGEYSRELSAKVFKGQCRLIQLGYRQGGTAGYGLRRVLVDQNGAVKGMLAMGEHKSIQTDRVVLQPGPPDELEMIRWMYLSFVAEGKTEREIADELNARGVVTDWERPWRRETVHQVLTNEKYIGNNVYNRISFKLKKARVRNPPDMLIRANGAFEPIVETDLFIRAQQIIAERSRRLSNEELLEWLKQIHQKRGRLSALIIDEYEEGPSSSVYQSRFGSLVRAYRMIGYIPEHDYTYLEINKQLRKLHPRIVERIVAGMYATGAAVSHDIETDLLTVNQEFTVSVVIARCIQRPGGAYRWIIRLDTGLSPDINVAVRMDYENFQPLDYYVLPATDITAEKLKLAETNGLFFDSYRFDDLDYLIGMSRRVHIREVI
ncbi:MAG: recombinase family protein [Candidatus Marsarchaeota archaeon]|nr:recombinase family protein [Candidatus Marsarchaeota archaeon]